MILRGVGMNLFSFTGPTCIATYDKILQFHFTEPAQFEIRGGLTPSVFHIFIVHVRIRIRGGICIWEPESCITIRNAQFLSTFDVSERTVDDHAGLNVPLPPNVLLERRVIEHAAEPESDGLGCCAPNRRGPVAVHLECQHCQTER